MKLDLSLQTLLVACTNVYETFELMSPSGSAFSGGQQQEQEGAAWTSQGAGGGQRTVCSRKPAGSTSAPSPSTSESSWTQSRRRGGCELEACLSLCLGPRMRVQTGAGEGQPRRSQSGRAYFSIETALGMVCSCSHATGLTHEEAEDGNNQRSVSRSSGSVSGSWQQPGRGDNEPGFTGWKQLRKVMGSARGRTADRQQSRV